MKKTIFILFLACMMLNGVSVSAEEESPWVHSLCFENDLFNGTDSNYTNGVKYSAISPDLAIQARRGNLSRRVLESIHEIPFMNGAAPKYTHKFEFAVGQNIYTPSDIKKKELRKG